LGYGTILTAALCYYTTTTHMEGLRKITITCSKGGLSFSQDLKEWVPIQSRTASDIQSHARAVLLVTFSHMHMLYC